MNFKLLEHNNITYLLLNLYMELDSIEIEHYTHLDTTGELDYFIGDWELECINL